MTRQNTELAPAHAADPASFSIADVLGLPHDASPEELLDIAVGEYNAAGLRMARAGAALNALRDVSQQLGNDFLPMVEARGIAKSHAYRAMQLADYLGGLPEADARRMLKVPYTKVLAIANADPEVVAELLEEGALDGAQPLSVRALRQRMRESEERAEALAVELETAKNQKISAEIALNMRAVKGAPPVWFSALRQEAAATHASMVGALDLFEQVLDELPTEQDLATPTLHQQLATAAASAWHLLYGEQARLGRVLERLQGLLGTEVPPLDGLQVLLGDERTTALATASTIFDSLQSAASTRAAGRVAESVRGRGRPPKLEPKLIRKAGARRAAPGQG